MIDTKYKILRRIKRLQNLIEKVQNTYNEQNSQEENSMISTICLTAEKLQMLYVLVSTTRVDTTSSVSNNLMVLSQVSSLVLQTIRIVTEQSIKDILSKAAMLIKRIRSVFMAQYTTALPSYA